jgi:Phosphopantetheine attachment site.
MIPTKFVVIEQFPLTFSGKIDRKALPNIVEFRYLSNLSLVDSPAQNECEQIIVEIIKKLLHLGEVNPKTNFFELGAHSLLLVELAYALSKALKREIKVVEIFAYPTVRLLSSHLSQANPADVASANSTTQRAQAKKSHTIMKRAKYVR